MPDRDRFLSALAHHQRRLRLTSAVWAFVAGAIATAATSAALSVASLQPSTAQLASVVVGTITFGSLAILWWRSWTAVRVASTIESRVTGLDNLVITAEEVIRATRDRVPNLCHVLLHQAARRLDEVTPDRVQVFQPAVMTCGCRCRNRHRRSDQCVRSTFQHADRSGCGCCVVGDRAIWTRPASCHYAASLYRTSLP